MGAPQFFVRKGPKGIPSQAWCTSGSSGGFYRGTQGFDPSPLCGYNSRSQTAPSSSGLGYLVLSQETRVRVPVGPFLSSKQRAGEVKNTAFFRLLCSLRTGGSSNGRTPGSGPGSRGSNPCPPAIFFLALGLLGLPLWSQPTHFEFFLSGTPQVGSFTNLRINALTSGGFIDPNFNETGHLYLMGPDTTADFYLSPVTVQFQAGVAQTSIQFTLADSVALVCETPTLTDTSQPFWVAPGSYRHVQILLPGEMPWPGTPEGKRGTPDPAFYLAPDTVWFFARLTDAYYNPVPDSDTVDFRCINALGANGFALLPRSVVLSGPGDSLPFSPRVAAAETRILGQGQQLEAPDTSAEVHVLAGPPAFLLPVLPGETLLPGDTTRNTWLAPGKSGEALPQPMDQPFVVDVYVVDAAYNPVQDITPLLGDQVDIYAYSVYTPTVAETDGPKPLDNLMISFTVVAPERGLYRVLAKDLDVPDYDTPYGTPLWVIPRAGGLETWAEPREIRSHDYSKVYARLTTASGTPIPGRTVRFQVLSGNSQLRPPIGVTDNQGIAYVLLIPSVADMGDTVWIEALADTLRDTTWVYIQGLSGNVWKIFPNPFVMSRHSVVNIAYKIYARYQTNLSKVRIEIFTPFGEPVWYKEIPRGEAGAIPGQMNVVQWDGRNLKGEKVASGVYDVYITFYGGGQALYTRYRTLGVVR